MQCPGITQCTAYDTSCACKACAAGYGGQRCAQVRFSTAVLVSGAPLTLHMRRSAAECMFPLFLPFLERAVSLPRLSAGACCQLCCAGVERHASGGGSAASGRRRRQQLPRQLQAGCAVPGPERRLGRRLPGNLPRWGERPAAPRELAGLNGVVRKSMQHCSGQHVVISAGVGWLAFERCTIVAFCCLPACMASWTMP